MIILEGINDIQQTPHQLDPAKIIEGFSSWRIGPMWARAAIVHLRPQAASMAGRARPEPDALLGPFSPIP